MLRKKVVLTWVLIISLVLLSGCGAGSAGAGQGSKDAAKEPYLIGVLTAQTGSASWLGDGELKAANMVAEQVNEGGGVDGHPLKVVPYDTASSPEQAVKGAGKLIGDGVVAIIGPSLVAESKAIAPLVKGSGPLVYSLSGGYRPENPWMFAASAQTEVMQQTVLDYFKAKGITKIALLAATDSTGQEAVDSLKEWMAKDSAFTLVALERVNPSDVDVSVQLNNIKSKEPQALIAWMTGKLVNVVAKNFYQLGLEIPLVVSHGNLSYTFLDGIQGFAPKTLLMPATKDFAWKSLPDTDPQKKINEKLHLDYKAKYGKEADFGPGVAYDAMNLIVKGLRQVGPDKEKLRAFLENTKNEPGATAIFNFSADDHRGTGRKDTVTLKVVGKEFTLAE
ncbi:ABC transporter substrate-binding protein [Paradesulfitobacterium ferrireducens]|uniref:ABC transporter substrate-binding protein n=1 Tax=Paradesulfitobacterium ferrireducens TaxID=2816476 RepID=UPI001A8F1BFB|nr:ABC transporter substrate-binding protein [Paradesulfitobacterium ferrireducens]